MKYIAIYAAAIIAANLSVAAFGPMVTPINAFFLIGLDLALRDLLHTRLTKWQMLGLIVGTGLVSYAINPASGMIAIASVIAFVASSCVDWVVFIRVTGRWLTRSNTSNIAGAAVDSVLFPTIAFGSLMPEIVLTQFVAKTFGGFLWAYLLRNKVSA